MKQSNTTKRRGLLAVLTLAVLLGGMLGPGPAMTVGAESESDFIISAESIPSDRQTYDICLTVENQGADWEGTVRLTVDEDYRKASAYDTMLSLPQGSVKQFVVKIPTDGVDSTDGTVRVALLDKKSDKITEKEFDRLLFEDMDALCMGILSDAYSGLTYLDMGGQEIWFYGDFYPIRLVELGQDNLTDTLDSLTFLVIDQYHTDVLTEEEKKAISLWVDDGGVLLIGTGAYAEDTLGGFGIQAGKVYAPGEMSDFRAGSDLDWSQLTLAELQSAEDALQSFDIQQDYYTAAWSFSEGNGSVCIVPYSFSELGSRDVFNEDAMQEYFVQNLLGNASNFAASQSNYMSDYADLFPYLQRMMGMVGSKNGILRFGWLKFIVVLYVIFVGPVLYLILRVMKRRELYWAAVPVTALVGILLVFLAGRGFEVVNTKVYSVTVENLSDSRKSGTYLYAYDADRREWDMRMADGYEYAGNVGDSYYYSDKTDYFYHFRKEGDALYVGIKPTSNFEDAYFYAGGAGNRVSEGRLTAQGIVSDWSGLKGTVVNETDRDLSYFAVICMDQMYVYENLAAGGTYTLDGVEPYYEGKVRSFFYSSNFYFLEDEKAYDTISTLAALGVGVCDFYSEENEDMTAVVGVVKDWDKTVNDNCSEISYGCLYTIQ